MNFLYIAMLIPIFGLFYAAFTSFLKYRQHRSMLDVLKVYAEKGEAPPQEVLAALTKGFSLAEPGVNAPARWDEGAPRRPSVQGPMHYWSLVGLFSVFAAGFAYASWSSGAAGYPFAIVAFTMGAVAVWALIMAVALTLKK
ncbi:MULTISPECIES: hypothetical protein [unclassified Brevundimonas]|uniref:hypothetical protein n=1 Tax=unclassified Brevundimonas TaxID=2622653 RepID=UPI0025B900B6|nr:MULTISPECIES: hypothetical protein [unclassified Brevundimonas]